MTQVLMIAVKNLAALRAAGHDSALSTLREAWWIIYEGIPGVRHNFLLGSL